jgi:hypothetical protein
MNYQSRNKIIVTFNDNTTLESGGSSEGIREHDLQADLKWIGYILPGHIRDKEMTMSDVKTVTITLDYKMNQ